MSEQEVNEPKPVSPGALIANCHLAKANLEHLIALAMFGDLQTFDKVLGETIHGLSTTKNQVHEALGSGIIVAPAGSERAAAEQMRRFGNGQN